MMSSMGKPPMPKSPMADEEGDVDEGKGGKLLALQNLLGAIEELSDEEIKPDIQRLMSQVHMGHEEAEGDQMGMDQASGSEDEMGKKPGMSVEIGVGGKPDEEPEESEDDEKGGMPKGGFLAILSKKMNKK